ncbi:serine threonine protein kinase : Serine/threonine protein kinase OS=Planctomyces brasiliensis (strain ATCC 49424 / DSM 5305 / JCM 21570 / NBRC 103401 / IFAM 1448) GN=Plabr_2195 PE=3 SV=1: Pkinase: NPCBM [Gemmataceae bacterium]|nr:serine threonine protein kinase : Serine/threonine protein kinase OS=Planctomyces brasiliensis (strain ATCC 49424 / DSM 5305 / JCM 21570 / NBRC 103401 / IFAM 1448) GN=Plabr_2195 PE=3 SV=1: Pkinase: NPCBM [Gemmataceae bacterium]VTT98971.1 serine threonine protein kinase : Serine/threonine protein kinase OS=Planctomyces brasiliensis (strain ATCC 49424 / DSM 5305 / JCM 21570 / NBRC 103401 / IFAM 1448) GN=Plabr_2195 PE=3 SV=1: Pkinase: NPCBM [Gemmataceae bacterium]
MGIPATTPEFLDLLAQSRLLDPATAARYAGDAADALGLAEVLVRDGLLTQFQADQLLQGKWKGFFIGRYKVLAMLGAGGMGKVFLCEHPGMRRQVAIKVLPPRMAGNPETVERFYAEARAIARLDHRNIVHAYDAAEDGGVHYLVMEYVKGVTLEDCVKREGPLGAARAVDYMRQSALGLQHAYEAGIVHRDIKPSNLLVTDTGVVKILDLGLAQFFEGGPREGAAGRSGEVMGTVDYMAPEQALDSGPVDIRADVYSLGATFYFALTGRSPFEGATTTQKLLMHQVRDPDPVNKFRPDLPPDLVAVLTRMMAKDPAHRFQTPDELLAILPVPSVETLADVSRPTADTTPEVTPFEPAPFAPPHDDAPVRPDPRPAPPPRSDARRKVAVIAGLCLLSAAAGVLATAWPNTAPAPVDEDAAPPATAAAPPRQPPTQTAARPVFLSEVRESESAVGHGTLGRAGSLGFDNRKITVRGTTIAQGIGMHPPADGTAHARYAIGGHFKTLTGAVAINDTGAGKIQTPVVFAVKGDGRVLWESQPTTKNQQQPFAIDLSGIHRLELEVRCPGPSKDAHAVWCDPKLHRVPVTLNDLDLANGIDADGYIRTWLVLAPVPHPKGVGIAQAVDRSFIKDEGKLEPVEGAKVKVEGRELMWERVRADGYSFDLEGAGGSTNDCSAYAVAYVAAPNEIKDVQVRIGSDDGAKVYVNGKQVGKFTGDRGIGRDQSTFGGVTLKKGVNVIVFKVCNGHGGFGGALRLTDASGTPIPNLKLQLAR